MNDRSALARRYLELRRPDRALDAIGPAMDEEAWAVRAEALLQLGRLDEAVESARRGLAEDPRDVTLLDLLALVEARRGDVAAAERALLAALGLLPEHPLLLAHYAHVLLQGAETARAAEVIAVAEQVAPDDPRVAGLRVAHAYVSGDRAALERASAELLRLDPESELGHRLLGVSLARRGDVRRAADHLAEAVRRDPTDRAHAEATRSLRVESHWLLKPLWPIRRLGPGRLWLVHIAILVALAAAANAAETVSSGLAAAVYVVFAVYLFAYVSLVLYSWLGAPLVRTWLRRR